MKIIFEDEYFLVVDKPSGLVVHSDGRVVEDTLDSWVAKKYPKLENVGNPHTLDSGRYVPRWGVVNRLDRETRGLILIAKDEGSFLNLQKQFMDRVVVKEYSAILHGAVDVDLLEKDGKIFSFVVGEKLLRNFSPTTNLYKISESLSRHKHDPRIWTLKSNECARQTVRDAETIMQIVDAKEIYGKKFTEVLFYPKTGRTHQLRLHAKFIGHPVLGDKKYGFGGIDNVEKIDAENILALTAQKLTFKHPKNEKCISVSL